MINRGYYIPQKRSSNHKSSTKSDKKKSYDKEIIKKCKEKVYFRANGSRNSKRIRIFYHDRARRNPYLYEQKALNGKSWIDVHTKYSEDDLDFQYTLGKCAPGYSATLNTVLNLKNDPILSKYDIKNYLKTFSYRPLRFKRCSCCVPKSNNKKLISNTHIKTKSNFEDNIFEILMNDYF